MHLTSRITCQRGPRPRPPPLRPATLAPSWPTAASSQRSPRAASAPIFSPAAIADITTQANTRTRRAAAATVQAAAPATPEGAQAIARVWRLTCTGQLQAAINHAGTALAGLPLAAEQRAELLELRCGNLFARAEPAAAETEADALQGTPGRAER